MRTPTVLIAGISVSFTLALGSCGEDQHQFIPPVHVDSTYPASDAVTARVGAELHRDDGISVAILQEGSWPLVPNTDTITTCCGDNTANTTMIVAGDGWLTQADADAIVKPISPQADRILNVLYLIDSLHDWQNNHPRPAAKPAAPGFNWGALVGVLALLGIVLAAAYIQVAKLLAHRRHRRRELAARAEQQHKRFQSGDVAGIYGDYPPAEGVGP